MHPGEPRHPESGRLFYMAQFSMTHFAKYCRTILAGSLVFGGAVAISVVGASLSASPAAAAAAPAAASHSVISRESPLRSEGLL